MRLPRPTLRLRLTALYGGLFLLSGAVLLTITYLAVRTKAQIHTSTLSSGTARASDGTVVFQQSGSGPGSLGPVSTTQVHPLLGPTGSTALTLARAQAHHLEALVLAEPAQQLHDLLVISLLALAVMALVSIGLGWIVSGRVLRPLRTITTTARNISAHNLHQRLALDGPNDELRELGDTFDALLERLEAAFAAQRQFVANASHELRTPLARQRTLGEVALGDPQPSIESLRESHRRVLAAGQEQQRLIESLLTLASSERGVSRREPFDLAGLAREAISARKQELEQRRLTLDAQLQPATAAGEPHLVERLLANLLDNALLYNHPSGTITVATAISEAGATITIANSGPLIEPEELARLLQPFERQESYRASNRDGSGLGLSIATAIAQAHGGRLSAQAQASGGLIVSATFPQ